MKNLKRTLSLLLCLIMVACLVPVTAFAADSDTEISTVVATLAYTLNPTHGAAVKTPKITVTTGNPAYFSSSMNVWQKKTGDTWENFFDSTFIAGTYRYSAQLRIDDSEGGEGYVLATEGLTVTVDGVAWAVGNVKDYGTYSLAAVFSPEFNVTTDSAATYTVAFDSDGGSAVTAQTVESGQTATKPADPTKSGYTFKGWSLEGSAYDFSSAVTKDITLKAKWEAIPTAIVIDEIHIGGVTMPVVGATPINSATTSTPGVTIGSDTFWVRYVPETNDLDDLYDDSTRVDDTPFRSGVKYSLQVMLEPQNGCTIAADAKIFYNGIQLPAPDISDPSKSCADVAPSGTMAVAFISGEASVPTTYTVTFDSDGGSAVTAQTVESGNTATKPANPTKSGYTFKGWTLDGAAYDFATPVTGNITLKAVWEENKPASTPQTGDNSNILLWSAMLFTSFFGVVVVLVLKKKNIFAR